VPSYIRKAKRGEGMNVMKTLGINKPFSKMDIWHKAITICYLGVIVDAIGICCLMFYYAVSATIKVMMGI
jgi:hypothetical protein